MKSNEDWRLRGLSEEQAQVVVEDANKDILISASAGSGKTRVLSERIAYRAAEGKLDPDRILVVTFTEAASLSMRRRIEDKIHQLRARYAERLENTPPGEERQKLEGALQSLRQASFSVKRCRISTFHAYCRSLIGQYIHELKDEKDAPLLHPGYKILDEAASSQMLETSADEVLREFYRDLSTDSRDLHLKSEREKENFKRLLRILARGKKERGVQEKLLSFYRSLRTYPDYFSRFGESFSEHATFDTSFAESRAAAELVNLCLRTAGSYEEEIKLLREKTEAWLEHFPSYGDFCASEKERLRTPFIYLALQKLRAVTEALCDDFLCRGTEIRLLFNEAEEDGKREAFFRKYHRLSEEFALLCRYLTVPSDASLKKKENQAKLALYKELSAHAERQLSSVSSEAAEKEEEELREKFPSDKGRVNFSKNYPAAELFKWARRLNELWLFFFGESIGAEKNGHALAVFAADLEEIESEERLVAELKEMLFRLLRRTEHAYVRRKKIENAADFADLIHYGYRIACLKADELRRTYDEVYIDEYQDTSAIQESLFAVMAAGKRFLVGDIKQSIYKFQGAKVENFRRRMQDRDRAELKFLTTNFRTDGDILTFINQFFRGLMTEEHGGLDYDATQEMRAGLSSERGSEAPGFPPKVLIWNVRSLRAYKGESSSRIEEKLLALRGDVPLPISAERAVQTERRLASYALAEMIGKKLRDGVAADSLAVLARSNRELDVLAQSFEKTGIPVSRTAEAEEYVCTRELASFLQVADNPNQDLPLLAYLFSALAPSVWTEYDLALLRSLYPSRTMSLLERMERCLGHGEGANPENEGASCEHLRQKIQILFDDLEQWRRFFHFLPMSEIVARLYQKRNYPFLCLLRERGEEEWRAAENYLYSLRGLSSTALEYLRDAVSLFEEEGRASVHLLTDAGLLRPQTGGVQLLSFHKSKGLEFDTVFLYLEDGKKNPPADQESLSLREDLGAALDLCDEHDFVYKSFRRQLFSELDARDELSEELRIFYVALTRAKKELHLVFGDANLKSEEEESGVPSDLDPEEKWAVRREKWMAAHPDRWALRKENQNIASWVSLFMKREGKNTWRPETERRIAANLPETLRSGATEHSEGRAGIWGYAEVEMDREALYSRLKQEQDPSEFYRRRLTLLDSLLPPETEGETPPMSGEPTLVPRASARMTEEEFALLPSKFAASVLAREGVFFSEKDARLESGASEEETPTPMAPEREDFDLRERLEEEESARLYRGIQEEMQPLSIYRERLKDAGGRGLWGSREEEGKKSEEQEEILRIFEQSLRQGQEGILRGGAREGSAVHALLRYLHFAPLSAVAEEAAAFSEELKKQATELLTWRFLGLAELEKALHFVEELRPFFRSGLMKRILRAEKNSSDDIYVQREAPFTLRLPWAEIDGDGRLGLSPEQADSCFDVQGVIDLYLCDEEGLVLLDYKSDRLAGSREEGRELLKDRYRAQLSIYEQALRAAWPEKKITRFLYSLELGELIEL